MIVGCCCYLICISKYYQINVTDDPADLALALTWGLSIGNFVNLLMSTFGEITKAMSSVQRIEEYAYNKEFEADWIEPKAPENWPNEGSISGGNVTIAYRKGLPNVLKNLDFQIEGGTKVGIIGRTGCGKSSLILSLVRIMEMVQNEETNLP